MNYTEVNITGANNSHFIWLGPVGCSFIKSKLNFFLNLFSFFITLPIQFYNYTVKLKEIIQGNDDDCDRVV